MIGIINRGSSDTNVRDDSEGWYDYELQAPGVSLKFTHRRIDGLAECLRRAADAVDDELGEGHVRL